MLYTTDAQLITPKMNRPILPESQIITPVQTEAAAAKLAPRPSIQATGTDVEGAFPMQEFDWRRAVDLHIGLLLTSELFRKSIFLSVCHPERSEGPHPGYNTLERDPSVVLRSFAALRMTDFLTF